MRIIISETSSVSPPPPPPPHTHSVPEADPTAQVGGSGLISIPRFLPAAKILQSSEIAYISHVTGSDHIRTISRIKMLMRSVSSHSLFNVALPGCGKY